MNYRIIHDGKTYRVETPVTKVKGLFRRVKYDVWEACNVLGTPISEYKNNRELIKPIEIDDLDTLKKLIGVWESVEAQKLSWERGWDEGWKVVWTQPINPKKTVHYRVSTDGTEFRIEEFGTDIIGLFRRKVRHWSNPCDCVLGAAIDDIYGDIVEEEITKYSSLELAIKKIEDYTKPLNDEDRKWTVIEQSMERG